MARLWLHDYDLGAVERQDALWAEKDRSDHGVLGAILVIIGSLGIAVLSNFLVGPVLVLAFVLSVMVLVAGLILAWTGRARHRRGGP